MTPKWKQFEDFVADIQRKLSRDASVESNAHIIGATGTSRQIDVCIRRQIGQFRVLIVVDCKDWKTPVDVKGVEEFCGLVEDVGANKGAIVCNAGFTDTAKAKARLKGIDLFAAIDVQSAEWPARASIPVLCAFTKLRKFSITFKHSAPGPFRIPNGDPRYTEVYRADGSRIDTVINLLRKDWNAQRTPPDPGRHENVPIMHEPGYFHIEDVIYGPVEILASIEVERNLYFGQLPVVATAGFRDELTGAYSTNFFETADVDAQEVEKSWTQIASESSLSVRPSFTLEACDQYPTIEGDLS